MSLLKSLQQRKGITIYFIVAFTIVILIFSIGNSIFISKRKSIKQNDPDRNVSLSFYNYKDVKVSDVISILKNDNIGIQFGIGNEELSIVGKKLSNDEELFLDMKEGRTLTNNELLGNDRVGLSSIKVPNNVKIPREDVKEDITIRTVGFLL